MVGSKRAAPRAKTRISTKADKVIKKGMEFVNRHNPYCYAGDGRELNKNAKTYVSNLSKNKATGTTPDDINYQHILGDQKTKAGYNYKSFLSAESSDHRLVDCSRFTKICFNEVGIDLSASSSSQRTESTRAGKKLNSTNDAKPGDLLWRNTGHVAIVGEDGKHAVEAQGWYYGCTYSREVTETRFQEAFRLIDETEDPGGEDPGGEDPGHDDPGEVSGNLLNATQARSAVIYNKKNNQSLCRQIQEVVGVEPDGSFSYETVQAIARWQKTKGLEADGKFGATSKAAAGFGSSAPISSTPVQDTNTEIALTSAQVIAAISYNKRNNQSHCKRIQVLVGVKADGVFGTTTIKAIAKWQHEKGLNSDGKFNAACRVIAGF